MKTAQTLFNGLLCLFLVLLVPSTSYAEVSKVGKARIQQRLRACADDPADEYVLYTTGGLYKLMRGRKYRLGDGVSQIAVANNPGDAAYLYYLQRGDLCIINCGGDQRTLLRDIRCVDGSYKFDVISSADSSIVNVALNDFGRFIAWGNKVRVFTERNIRDYCLNPGFGKGGPFSSYVAFLIDYQGFVTRLKSRNPGSSKADYSRKYANLDEFLSINEVH